MTVIPLPTKKQKKPRRGSPQAALVEGASLVSSSIDEVAAAAGRYEHGSAVTLLGAWRNARRAAAGLDFYEPYPALDDEVQAYVDERWAEATADPDLRKDVAWDIIAMARAGLLE